MNKIKKIILIFFIIFFLFTGFYSFFIEPEKLSFTEYTINDEQLKGLKIVFVGDFHVKPHQQNKLKKIVKIINNQNPDLVLSTGDFVSGHLKPFTLSMEKIAKELSYINAKYGFYTSLGNHDQYIGTEEIKNELEKNNIVVLNNNNKKIHTEEKDFYIAGIQYKPKTEQTVKNSIPETELPVIVLTHSPDEIEKIPSDVNLILAGHTHGGQIVFPILGPVITSSKYHKKYVYGKVEENGKIIIITRGIGVSILPFRFNCPPEIVIIKFE